jgi:hypothetical protein
MMRGKLDLSDLIYNQMISKFTMRLLKMYVSVKLVKLGSFVCVTLLKSREQSYHIQRN